jgi:hypothetical protein
VYIVCVRYAVERVWTFYTTYLLAKNQNFCPETFNGGYNSQREPVLAHFTRTAALGSLSELVADLHEHLQFRIFRRFFLFRFAFLREPVQDFHEQEKRERDDDEIEDRL